ncbi:MAG: hypothetical protein EBR30_17205 [Cytophagia bacterium]|nr:hypothetical protein [Cytophagia bacterium]NBW36721.1 hypothetical protein [Cytophagia bacterium]
MASLKITRADGTVSQHEITPAIEYAFEQYAKKGFYLAFAQDQKQSDIYWLAWECLRRADAPDVKPFGDKFLETLKAVEVLGDEYPNG